jgi:hypothetical protein
MSGEHESLRLLAEALAAAASSGKGLSPDETAKVANCIAASADWIKELEAQVVPAGARLFSPPFTVLAGGRS